MKRSTVSQGARLAVQIVSFILLPGLFVDALAGMHTIFALATGTGSINESSVEQLIALGLVAISSAVVGRVFCGWMCAFGTMGDLLHLLGQKVFHLRFRLSASVDRVLKYMKYVILALIIGVIWTNVIAVPEAWSPWEAFAVIAAWPPDLATAFTRYGVGLVVLLAVMVGSVFVERLFCRYLCPVGALLSIVSLVRVGRVDKPRQACGKCHACTSACAMGIDLGSVDTVRSGECIDCLKCVSICPRQNASFVEVSPDLTPLVTTAAAASIVGLSYVGSVATPALLSSSTTQQATQATSTAIVTEQAATTASTTTSPSTSPTTATSSESASASTSTTGSTTSSSSAATTTSTSGLADGTYTGTGSGHRGTTTIAVTISGGRITNIVTESTQDDAKYYDRAFSTVTSEIISAQSADVDAVSGATHSSDGIMEAVAAALAKAGA